MWYKLLKRNFFISKLYTDVPRLIDVRVSQFEILNGGHKVAIVFDMPYYADNPPDEWIDSGFNTVTVRLDFFGIKNVNLESSNNRYRANIEMMRSEDNTIITLIKGSIKAKIEVEVAMIQSIGAYCNDEI